MDFVEGRPPPPSQMERLRRPLRSSTRPWLLSWVGESAHPDPVDVACALFFLLPKRNVGVRFCEGPLCRWVLKRKTTRKAMVTSEVQLLLILTGLTKGTLPPASGWCFRRIRLPWFHLHPPAFCQEVPEKDSCKPLHWRAVRLRSAFCFAGRPGFEAGGWCARLAASSRDLLARSARRRRSSPEGAGTLGAIRRCAEAGRF